MESISRALIISIALLLVLLSILSAYPNAMLIHYVRGYCGTDGLCTGPKYVNVTYFKNGTIILSLAHPDYCECGCDTLAQIGLTNLTNGTWNITLSSKVLKIEQDENCKFLTGISVRILSYGDLFRTGFAGYNTYVGNGIIISPPGCWDCKCFNRFSIALFENGIVTHSFEVNTSKTLTPDMMLGKVITYNIELKVRGNLVKIMKFRACIEGIGCYSASNITLPPINISKPWLVIYARIGYSPICDHHTFFYKIKIFNIKISKISKILECDFNGDGKLTLSDVILGLKALAGLYKPTVHCDLNHNGKLDIGDIILLLEKVLQR